MASHVAVFGSTKSSEKCVEMTTSPSGDVSLTIAIGIKEILSALEDVLANQASIEEDDFDELCFMADRIIDTAIFRDIERGYVERENACSSTYVNQNNNEVITGR